MGRGPNGEVGLDAPRCCISGTEDGGPVGEPAVHRAQSGRNESAAPSELHFRQSLDSKTGVGFCFTMLPNKAEVHGPRGDGARLGRFESTLREVECLK